MGKGYLNTCDGLLEEIRRHRAALATLEGMLAKEIEKAKAPFELDMVHHRDGIKALDVELKALAMTHKGAIFDRVVDGSARVDVPHGALIYQAIDWVVRAKGMLSTLEKMDRRDLMKIEKSVNWDAFKPLPDDELEFLGTRRETREKIDYEIKEG